MSMWTGEVAPRFVTSSPKDWVGLAARLILGGALLYAGALKVGNIEGSIAAVEAYQLPLPLWMIMLWGTIQPFVEIALGLLLILGIFTRISAILGTLLMVVFIAGIIWAWANGLSIDCGCFTPGGELADDEQTQYARDIVRDIGFIIAGVWLWVRPRSALSVDTWLLKPITIEDEEHNE